MITVWNDFQNRDMHFMPLDGYTKAEDAARALYADVFKMSKRDGGAVELIEPDEGEEHYVVYWKGGPAGWARMFAANPESDTHEFKTVAMEDGISLRLEDND